MGGGTACHPTFAEVRKTCYDLPPGQRAITFPAPWLDRVPCDPDLSCREGTLEFVKELLVAGLLVLALLPFLGCAFRAHYRKREKQICSASGDEGEAPTRGSSAAPGGAQGASLASSASSGAFLARPGKSAGDLFSSSAAPGSAQGASLGSSASSGAFFARSKKSAGGLFSQQQPAAPGGRRGPTFGAGGGGPPRPSASPSW